MTVTIKNSNGNVIGIADSINIVSKYKDIVSTKNNTYNEKILETNFSLINPSYHPYYTLYRDNLNIEAKVGFINNLSISSNQIISLTNCTLIKDYFGIAKDFKVINLITSDNIESVFKYYFPKLKYYSKSNSELIAYLTKEEYLLYLRFNLFGNKWRVCLHFGENNDKLELHESTDLNELMQVTKQKLNDMFADWSSKVN